MLFSSACLFEQNPRFDARQTASTAGDATSGGVGAEETAHTSVATTSEGSDTSSTSAESSSSMTELGLVAAFPLEEQAGTLAADILDPSRALLLANMSWIDEGRYGGGVSSGLGSSAVLQDASELAEFSALTVTLWFRRRTAQWSQSIETLVFVASDDECPHVAVVAINENSLGRALTDCQTGEPDLEFEPIIELADTDWHHLAFSFGDGKSLVALDGVWVEAWPSELSPEALGEQPSCGMSGQVLDDSFDGELDEFRIYRAILTLDELTEDMMSGVDQL